MRATTNSRTMGLERSARSRSSAGVFAEAKKVAAWSAVVMEEEVAGADFEAGDGGEGWAGAGVGVVAAWARRMGVGLGAAGAEAGLGNGDDARLLCGDCAVAVSGGEGFFPGRRSQRAARIAMAARRRRGFLLMARFF
jgi:hypothetical protein